MKQKWDVLSSELKAAKIYRGDRIDPESLQRRVYSGRGVIRETCEVVGHRTIFAYGALWPTWLPQWWEVGTLWVRQCHRGKGLTNEILENLIRRAPSGAHLLLFTREERIIRILGRHGFQFVTTRAEPDILLLASDLGIVQRLPEGIHDRLDAPEPGTRSLFVRRGGWSP